MVSLYSGGHDPISIHILARRMTIVGNAAGDRPGISIHILARRMTARNGVIDALGEHFNPHPRTEDDDKYH